MGIPPTLLGTVTSATKPVPAITGGTLLAMSDGKTAVAADPDRDRVYVVDLTNDTVRSTIMLSEGDEPGRVIEDGAKRVHVALRRGGALVTIDPATGTVVGRRAVCSAPRGLAYQATGDLVHVACAGGELVSFPAASGAATRTLKLENDLRDIVLGANGSLLVSTFRRAEVLVVGSDGKIGKRLRPSAGTVPNVLMGGTRHTSPSVAWRMLPMGDAQGSVVILHQMGVDDEINPAAGGYAGIKGCSAIVEAGVSVIAPDGTAPPMATGYEQVSLAVDVALSPDKSMMALAVPGNGATQFPSVVMGSTQTMGNGGCSFLGTGTMAPPKGGEVVAVSYASNTLLLAQLREPAVLWRGDTGTQITL
jgi:DNA-binding beta-propeller fold protein YncE